MAGACTAATSEEDAVAFISHAWSGDIDSVLSIGGDDLAVAGCDALEGMHWISRPNGGVGACPENGSELALNVMLGYYAHAARLNTRVLDIACEAAPEFSFLEGVDAEPLRCFATATNDLLDGDTYRAEFLFGFAGGSMVAIEEIGHPYEAEPGNSTFPPDVDPALLEAAVDPHCGNWRDGDLDPHQRPNDRSWWVETGQECAMAWRAFFAPLEDPD